MACLERPLRRETPHKQSARPNFANYHDQRLEDHSLNFQDWNSFQSHNRLTPVPFEAFHPSVLKDYKKSSSYMKYHYFKNEYYVDKLLLLFPPI